MINRFCRLCGREPGLLDLYTIYKSFSFVHCMEHSRILTVQPIVVCSLKSRSRIFQTVEKRLQQGEHTLNQSHVSASIDYDGLMRPNKAEEDVHGCMIPARVYYEIRVITWI